MSPRGRSAGFLLAAALLAAVGEPRAAGAADPATAPYDIRELAPDSRDIDIGGRDLVFSVQEMDGSVTDTRNEKQVELTLAADVFFAFDKDTLNVATAVTLAGLAERIGTEAKGSVRIVGYTDAVGNAGYNLDLSKRRAATVQAELERKLTGRPLRFESDGKGATDFVAPNTAPDGSDNPDGRARNRRVTITYER
jgi:OOP family OmpA-OmpF porin